MNKKALVTGSFDPPTIGHLALIQQAASLFSHVVVGVFRNREKEFMFSVEERVKMLEAMIEETGLVNVSVDVDDGYVADYAAKHGIQAVFRGVRKNEDVAYELEMGRYNHKRNPDLETYLWIAPDSKETVSSTEVRRLLHCDGDPSHLLTPAVFRMVSKRT